MLTSLRIEQFAIVSLLELDFSQGMTAFTGETGAGKSIMIDALLLALGGRGDASVIRQGADKCDITACFQIEAKSLPAAWLDAHDIPHDGGEVLLRRVLYPEGRSKSSINGQPFPLQKIKELSELLVDIHGQHQHQTLLNHQTHRQQLDDYADHATLQDAVLQAYKQCSQIKQSLDALEDTHASTERIALLQYQLEELVQLQLVEGEMPALHQEHQVLHHARDYLAQSQQAIDVLQENDQVNVLQALHTVLQILNGLPQDHAAIKNSVELIHNAVIQCEEAVNELNQFLRHVQLDPERLLAVEERMSLLLQAARKYHTNANELPETMRSLQESLDALQQLGNDKERLQSAYLAAKEAYNKAALALRASRQHHAFQLAEEISAKIRQLGMPKGYIEVVFSPLDRMQPHGLDKIEYHVCTNPGMPADSLAKIASGGELSRISLAIQMVTAQRGTTPTLLFDEVDVGIGGATAALVGQMLRQLGERLQIFCVTHQPQVASCAHAHFRVEKFSDGDTTVSHVTALDTTEKVHEIARMLGGLTITEHTLSHARELLGIL